MLIRLMGHHINNPHHIDKLICIKGLPEDWFFRESKYGGKELIRPWLPEIEVNVPSYIRHMCDVQKITVYHAPIDSNHQPVIDKDIPIIGVRLEFNTQPGQEMWDKIERYLDRVTPRDQQVPVPVMVAKDHKGDGLTAFAPHVGRKNVRGSLEVMPAEIPVVDFRKTIEEPQVVTQPLLHVEQSVSQPLPLIVQEQKQPEIFKCVKCERNFKNEAGLKIHKGRCKGAPVDVGA